MITDHQYTGALKSGASCQFIYRDVCPNTPDEVCARQAMEHEVTPALNIQVPEEESFPFHQIYRDGEAVVAKALGSNAGLRGKATSPEAEALEESAARGTDVVRAADAAQYARPAIPAEQRGQIRVRLLNATPDPLGSVAALIEQYKGNVIRSLSEVTDEQRRAALADMGKTVLSGPLEAVQFHWQIEGVTRSITHQMVRSRASFFAQESLRFAVPEGRWSQEIPLPPYLSGSEDKMSNEQLMAKDRWIITMADLQAAYGKLIEFGMPAEEARGVLPHDMPTRIHWVCDLRTLLAEAGKRTCTQAQQPWRLIFAGMASALRGHRRIDGNPRKVWSDSWQYEAIANALRPVCYQTGSCGFMAAFDRSCSIRERVAALGSEGLKLPSERWSEGAEGVSIQPWEWMANPGAARS